MGSPPLFPFTLLLLVSLASMRIEAQGIRSTRLLDLLIRDYTFKSYDIHFRTGVMHAVQLPANFSGIIVDSARFRCGSLRRYGARLKEFHLSTGVTIQPCVERVMVIRQNLGSNWSSIYYANYDLSGYQLMSPILGLTAYNVENDVNFGNPFELGIYAAERPITVDFRNTISIANVSGNRPVCASFEKDGKVTLKGPISHYICAATRNGHYGLVIRSPPRVEVERKISRWKVVVGSTVGTSLGVFLLGLLLVAIFANVKKKARMEEMERRAYEEEALQVSMVGHVRAPTAAGTRTKPTIGHEYTPYLS